MTVAISTCEVWQCCLFSSTEKKFMDVAGVSLTYPPPSLRKAGWLFGAINQLHKSFESSVSHSRLHAPGTHSLYSPAAKAFGLLLPFERGRGSFDLVDLFHGPPVSKNTFFLLH